MEEKVDYETSLLQQELQHAPTLAAFTALGHAPDAYQFLDQGGALNGTIFVQQYVMNVLDLMAESPGISAKNRVPLYFLALDIYYRVACRNKIRRMIEVHALLDTSIFIAAKMLLDDEYFGLSKMAVCGNTSITDLRKAEKCILKLLNWNQHTKRFGFCAIVLCRTAENQRDYGQHHADIALCFVLQSLLTLQTKHIGQSCYGRGGIGSLSR